jgi:hypothetical protein
LPRFVRGDLGLITGEVSLSARELMLGLASHTPNRYLDHNR